MYLDEVASRLREKTQLLWGIVRELRSTAENGQPTFGVPRGT